jgi:pimeloyl-ACP methyl ester carboxylesterase
MEQALTNPPGSYVQLEDASIYWESTGHGQPLIFIHGMGLDCRIWDDQLPVFSTRYRVIRYDLRGFGRSSLPSENRYAHHTDLSELLRHLEIRKAVLVGLSLGGRVAIDFAITYPSRVTALVLVDSALHGFAFSTFTTNYINDLAREAGMEKARQAWYRHKLFGSARKNPAVADRLAGIIQDYTGWHWINKNPWEPIRPPAKEQLFQIGAPALVMVGEKDLPDFGEIADTLAAKIPGAEKLVLPGAGHMVNMEDPGTFNREVLGFLKRNGLPG